MKNLLAFVTGVLFVAAVFAVNVVYGQDSTGVSGLPSFTLPGKMSIWLTAAIAVYELVIRFVPTVKSFSIVTWVIRIVQLLVPDKSTKGTNHD